jgi:Tol biopolymer transport system component
VVHGAADDTPRGHLDTFLMRLPEEVGGPPMNGVSAGSFDLTRVSVSSMGSEANGGSGEPAISANGRFVAFVANAEGLAPGDDNGLQDVYVRDRWRATTRLVSVGTHGKIGNEASINPSISRNGRFIAFVSAASNLVPGDPPNIWEVYVRDMRRGVTRRVSVGPNGEPLNAESGPVDLSANGRFVSFASAATNVLELPTEVLHVYRRDLRSGDTALVSRTSVDASDPPYCLESSLSRTGRYVAFGCLNPLAIADTNLGWDIYIRDMSRSRARLVTVAPNGTSADGDSLAPAISGDGRHIAFQSEATNLISGDKNGEEDVYVASLNGSRITRVSVGPGGVEGNYESQGPDITQHGRFVAFMSRSALLPNDVSDGSADVYMRDRMTKNLHLISVNQSGEKGNEWSAEPAFSRHARPMAYASSSSNLVPGDTNANSDVFVLDRLRRGT